MVIGDLLSCHNFPSVGIYRIIEFNFHVFQQIYLIANQDLDCMFRTMQIGLFQPLLDIVIICIVGHIVDYHYNVRICLRDFVLL
jgi:hypothetical protein